MRKFKKVVSLIIVSAMIISGFPANNYINSSQAYAEETVNITYDNFSDTSDLKLNGDSLIKNNAIEFENNGIGKSVFTENKIALGEKLSFSTAFSFENITLDIIPDGGTEGGFTFTLQSIENSVTTVEFGDESINPSLSIAFITKYMDASPTVKLKDKPNNLLYASLGSFQLASGPMTRCEISAEVYINGSLRSSSVLDTYNVLEETVKSYNIWIGYDGEKNLLHFLSQDSLGEYNLLNTPLDLSDVGLGSEVFAGFMGSMGDAGNTSEISKWYFKSDLSLIGGKIVDLDEAWLESRMETYEIDPIDYLDLPLWGHYGSTISWESSNTNLVTEDGTLTPPSVGEGNKEVTLTATITKGSAVTTTRPFTIIIKVSDESIVQADYDWLIDEIILGGNVDLVNIVSDFNLPSQGEYGSSISWESDNLEVVSNNGEVARPIYPATDTEVTLTAVIKMGDYIKDNTFTFTVKALGMTDVDKRNADLLWLTGDKFSNGNNLIYVTMDLNLLKLGHYGSTISWTSNNEAVIKSDGTVIRPLYSDGYKSVELTASISYGASDPEIKSFTVTVINLEQTDEEKRDADAEWLTNEEILNGNTSLDNITGDLTLPPNGPNGSTINWESDNIIAVNTNGRVTRAVYAEGNQIVNLIATINMGTSTTTKDFTVTVLAYGQTNAEKLDADAEWLTDAQIKKDNTSLDNIVGNLLLPIEGPNESTINWVSNGGTFVDAEGKVTRPTYTQGDQTIMIYATINKDGSSTSKSFTITIKKLEQTDAEKLAADNLWLTDEEVLNENDSKDNVTGDLILPSKGPNGSTIIWESNKDTVVDIEGKVMRPSHTIGDETVIITAAISKGSVSTTKTFTLKVKSLDQTGDEKDREKLDLDVEWLINKLTSDQDLDNIITSFTLNTKGKDGSTISWTSSNEEIINVTTVQGVGTVYRPKYDQPAEIVTLTASLSMGSFTREETFSVKVLQRDYMFDHEAVESDYEWLTEELILNGNSSLDNVISNLYLPSKGVGWESLNTNVSSIEWWISNPNIISNIGDEGHLFRPRFSVGDRPVNITATLRCGQSVKQKTFKLLVRAEDTIDDEESVTETLKWLNLQKYNILGDNISENAIRQDLSWPTSGLYDSTIKWESEKPDIISNDGIVTQAETGEGNKRVNVIATVTKGEITKQIGFQYIVLEKPDIIPPVVISSKPENNSTKISWDTRNIIITYDEDIVLNQNLDIELEVKNTNKSIKKVDAVTVNNNRLNITSYSPLTAGENKLFIPAGGITDKAGNPAQAYELKFTVEEKLVRNIEVVSSSIYNTEKDVDPNISEISIRFNSTDLVKGKYFDIAFSIIFMDGIIKDISVTNSLSEDMLTMKLNEPLAPGTTYTIMCSRDGVKDRFLNTNSSTRIIQFQTRGIAEPKVPQIESIYPANGQTNISINPNIEVVFSDLQKFKNYDFKLTDALGKEYSLYAPYILDMGETKMIFKPREALKANMVYTLSAPYRNAKNPYQNEFSTQFTTASGPRIIRTSPSTGDFDADTRGVIEIYFDSPVTQGINFKDITFKNYFGDPVKFTGEEIGSKVILKSLSELDSLPYTIHIPFGACKDSSGLANSQNAITFYAKAKEKLPMGLGLEHLDIPDIGFVGKHFMINVEPDQMTNWEQYVRLLGYGPISYEWAIDGQTTSINKNFYHRISDPGEYEIRLTVKDKYGFTYEVEKTIEIKELQEIVMSLKDNGQINKIGVSETGQQAVLNYDLRLEQDNRFIHGENIKVKLYKDGILQRLSDYGDGGINISSKIDDNAYRYTYTPKFGDAGTYELEFTYDGFNGEQVIRQAFTVVSDKPNVTDVFRFRLYEDRLAKYYEDLEYVYVILNGERIRADKEMYTYNGSTFPVYAVHKTLQTNTYHDLKVENWFWGKSSIPFFLGKDNDNPEILSGSRQSPESKMGITNINMNSSESDLKNVYSLYFQGFSTKLVLDVKGDWAGTDPGYYEIASLGPIKNISEYKDTAFKSNFIQSHNSKSEIQKITVQPGIQLKDNSEQYWIRMVSPQGYKSTWKPCPHVVVAPLPNIMGKKFDISIQDKEYAISWPTVFDGPIGDAIGILDGIPGLGGGGFGLGGKMPEFNGEIDDHGYGIDLTMEAKAGLSLSKKKSEATKYKRLKKVTVIGFSFEIEVEGGITLFYNYETDQWDMEYLYLILDGDIELRKDIGYKILGVGFTIGMSMGTRFHGFLMVEDGTDYSGVVGITPGVGLHVDAGIGLAEASGSLIGRIPAEIHFPTGYIGAGVTLVGEIKGTLLGVFSGTLLKVNFVDEHWDNGQQKVILKSFQMPREENHGDQASGIHLISRDYLGRQSNWLGGNTNSSDLQGPSRFGMFNSIMSEKETNLEVMDMMENIFPNTKVQLAINGDQEWLVWVDDNPSRDSINRTQLRYTTLKDGVWTTPQWMYDDGTADIDPVLARTENGILMAWHNIGKVMTEDQGLDEMLTNSQISVTQSVYTEAGNQPNVITLTNDDKINHSPKIAGDGNKALLVWTKSEGLNFSLDGNSSSEADDKLYFSAWTNDEWTEEEAIDMEFATILDSSLIMKDGQGLLLYTVDKDSDLSTGEDREIFARLYDGYSWSMPTQLTDNLSNDSVPKAVYINGQWFITWLEDGKISYKIGLDGETKTEEGLNNIQGNYKITAREGQRPLVALVYTQPGEDWDLDMHTSFYDFNNGKWSGKIELVKENKYTGAMSTSFDDEGKLNVAFTQADIITEAIAMDINGVEELIEGKSISDKVDLKLLKYRLTHDLALIEGEGMFLSREYPLASTITTVYVALGNLGDFAENVVVYLYDGNPDEGGVKIAETDPQLINAGSIEEVEIEWLVGPEEKNEYDLYAVVEPIDGVEETRTYNNTVSLKVSTSDIAITGVTCENPGADDYLINLTLANTGATVLEGATVLLEDEDSGEVLETRFLRTMEIGDETVVTYMIKSDGRENIIARVRLPQELNENNRENNTLSFILKPRHFELMSLNIGPWDEQVDIESEIVLEFNMSIDRASGFEDISLIDDDFNNIAINKVIENDILTIKPVKSLKYGTRYELKIPKDALGDFYRHTLRNEFNMNFTTLTRNPEIVSAYPGDYMDNTALNTDINLGFNQNVIKGYEFSEITLYQNRDGLEPKNIPVTASIKGELLTINYLGNLNKNTAYNLKIPRGAVENNNGEIQGENYLLVFMTGEEVKEEKGPNQPGEPEEPSQPEGPGGSSGSEDKDKDDKPTPDPDVNVYEASIVNLGDMEKTVEIHLEGENAIIKLGSLAEEMFSQNKETVINIPSILEIGSYTIEMLATTLSVTNKKAVLKINTDIGSIRIPSNMLSGMLELEGKNASITISDASRGSLPANVKTMVGNKPVIQLTLELDGVEIKWNNPDAFVGVSIPYTPKGQEVESPESIIIRYIDGTSNMTIIKNGYYDQNIGAVRFATNDFSYFAVVHNKVDFNDVKENAWYKKAVNFAAAREITLGTGNGNFSPENRLTRAEFITMMMRAYDIEPDKKPGDNFSDAGDTWYTGYLARAKTEGISLGMGNNMFAPNQEITRQEMFTLLYNALGLVNRLPEINKLDESTSIRTLSEFTDQGEVAPWAKDAMTLLVETGTIIGGQAKLTPNSTTTRAEMAQVLYNLMTSYISN